jgi:virginiamycin B lyase
MTRALCLAGCLLAPLVLPAAAWAGGSGYGVAPGALADVAGQVEEWPVPTPKFARDPAPAPDGSIYIAVMYGNRIARFDPATQQFREWELPKDARPHGVLVDREGIVWYTGNGNGSIGRLDPKSGAIRDYRTPSGGDPHTLVLEDKAGGAIWFTVQNGQRIGRLERQSGHITEYRTSGNPYGIAIDRQGYVWFCRIAADRLGRLDPATGVIDDFDTGAASKPRRMAVGPDGMLWVTAYGRGRLLKIDPVARKLVKSYALPAGEGGGPYAVTVDAAGRVWANEIATDTVVVLEPGSERPRVIPLPSKGIGIRKAIIDAKGNYWYMGSHNGRLGRIR